MLTSQPRSAVLVATLGSEPQVVTTTLDLLQERGERIHKICVVHTWAEGTTIKSAVEMLKAALEQPPYSEQDLNVEFLPVTNEDGTIFSDINTTCAAQAFFRLLYQRVWQIKHSGQRVHLSIAGGRKTMAVFGMATAQLLFDENDQLWHLFSTGDFLNSKRLHPGPQDQVHLVPIPVILWGQASPVFANLSRIEDPYVAVELTRKLQLREKIDSARAFVLGSLTPAERRVVEALVEQGLSDRDIAEQLYLSPRTVEQHLRSAYAKASDHWELDGVTRTQLVALLQIYFTTQITGNP